MYDLIQQELLQLLPTKRKRSNEWISFNAVCCVHNRETPDTRGRGGVHPNPNGSVTYHCFNCGFKTGFYPGRPISFKFRKLLSWLGADSSTIQRLTVEALRIKELVPAEELTKAPEVEISFKARSLPDNSASIAHWATFLRLGAEWSPDGFVDGDKLEKQAPQQFWNAVDYVYKRKVDIKKYNFYLTDDESYNLHRRLIIPFYYKGDCIGYTARALEDNITPKYHSNYEANFVFNLDMQKPESKIVLVAEGPFDAMCIDGVATLSNDCNETQAEIIESLGKEVIVVPDQDEAGMKLVDRAIELGWSVSMPDWPAGVKDVNDAVIKIGKLATLITILAHRETSKIKIELRKKQLVKRLRN